MLIEQICPDFVAEKSTLHERLCAEGKARGFAKDDMREIISSVPQAFIDAGAFLDRMTNLWRYEFGVPYDIGENMVYSTDMWVPVHCLFNALTCAHSRLPNDKRVEYLRRMADPGNHQDTLVEMIPGYKVDSAVAVEFEVLGQGVGNRTVDWVIGPHNGRAVLLDVKRRIFDTIDQIERLGGESVAPEPDHDPALLFRSVEERFVLADPNLRLQGVWISTNIRQNERQLSAAFSALSSNKIHFAILGDWKPDAYVLVRRAKDEQYLRDLFHVEKSTRFTFTQVQDSSSRQS